MPRRDGSGGGGGGRGRVVVPPYLRDHHPKHQTDDYHGSERTDRGPHDHGSPQLSVCPERIPLEHRVVVFLVGLFAQVEVAACIARLEVGWVQFACFATAAFVEVVGVLIDVLIGVLVGVRDFRHRDQRCTLQIPSARFWETHRGRLVLALSVYMGVVGVLSRLADSFHGYAFSLRGNGASIRCFRI